MTPKAQVLLLGAIALGIVVFALSRGLGGKPDDVVGATTGQRPREVATLTSGAKPSVSLVARYQPIVDADPFSARAFRPRDARGGGRDGGRDDPERASSGPASNLVSLRLTGVAAVGSGLVGLFEERARARGLLVVPGDKLGDRSVAEVRSDCVILALPPASTAPVGSRTTTLALGDRIELAPEVIESRLGPVGPPATPSWQTEATPALTDEQKDSILERLRARRKASLGGDKEDKPK